MLYIHMYYTFNLSLTESFYSDIALLDFLIFSICLDMKLSKSCCLIALG